jgi:hypothetical protein
MTKSIIVTYDDADESILMNLLKKIKAKTEVLDAKKMSKISIDQEQNRIEILAATAELDNQVFHKITKEDLYELINN